MTLHRFLERVASATGYAMCAAGAFGGASLFVHYLPSDRPSVDYFGGALLGGAGGLGITIVPVTLTMAYFFPGESLARKSKPRVMESPLECPSEPLMGPPRPPESQAEQEGKSHELSDKVER